MKVKATKQGFIYGILRHPGQQFDLVARKVSGGKNLSASDQFSEAWMERVLKPGPKSSPKPTLRPREPVGDSQ